MWYIYLGIAIFTVFLAVIIDLELSQIFFYCPTCERIQQWARTLIIDANILFAALLEKIS